jgi:hypothetical protein
MPTGADLSSGNDGRVPSFSGLRSKRHPRIGLDTSKRSYRDARSVDLGNRRRPHVPLRPRLVTGRIRRYNSGPGCAPGSVETACITSRDTATPSASRPDQAFR